MIIESKRSFRSWLLGISCLATAGCSLGRDGAVPTYILGEPDVAVPTDVQEPDVQVDAAGLDVAVDADVEEDTEARETVCGDDVDNDGDGLTDMSDPDCPCFKDGRKCLPPFECWDDRECPPEQVCNDAADACVYGEVAIDDYVPTSEWAYVNALRIGEAIPSDATAGRIFRGDFGDACCLLLEGDSPEDKDDDLGQMWAIAEQELGREIDVNGYLQERIETGESTFLLEYRNGFGEYRWEGERLNLFAGTSDADGDGVLDGDFSVWDSGEGFFRVFASFFGPTGPLLRLDSGGYDHETGDYVGSGRGPLVIYLPLHGLDVGLGYVPIAVRRFVIRSRLGRTPESVTDTQNVTLNDVEYGGGMVAGFVLLDDVFSIVNRVLAGCSCAFDTATMGPPRVCYGDSVASPENCANRPDSARLRYYVGCVGEQYDVSDCDASSICREIPLLCDKVLPALADSNLGSLDTDGYSPDDIPPGSGINDAMTFGFRYSTVRARIDDGFYVREGSGE